MLDAYLRRLEPSCEFRFCDLGYPQPAAHLRMDNTVALGIAEGKTNGKRSKSMDMRFFWLADRVAQRQFNTSHVPGQWNIADRCHHARHHFCSAGDWAIDPFVVPQISQMTICRSGSWSAEV